MPQTSLFTGLAILAMIVATANAQGRIYRSSSDDHVGAGSNSASNDRGGVASNDSSDDHGGVILNATPAPEPPTTPNNTAPAGTASVTHAQANTSFSSSRPIFITSSPDRDSDGDRDFDRGRDFEHHHHYYVLSAEGEVYDPNNDEYPLSNATDFDHRQRQQTTGQSVEPEVPAPTIFENRPGYRPASMQPASNGQNFAATTGQMAASQMIDGVERTSAADPQPTTILVFRDGHQLEIGNYAIVGDTIYNLAGDYKTHKILLADLDLDKTIKANRERGYDFRLPKRQGS